MTTEELLEKIEEGDAEAVAVGWRIAARALEAAEKDIDRGRVRLSQLFCFVRDVDEFAQRDGPFADWRDDWRARNPDMAAEEDELQGRVLSKLQAKARDGSLVPWCQRHGLNPAAVANFAFGGTGRMRRQ